MRATLTAPKLDKLFEAWIIHIDGYKLPRTFTPRTPRAAVERFLALCEAQADTLLPMIHLYHGSIAYNSAHLNHTKSWPIFAQMERYLNKLQREAGIVNT